MNPACYRGRGDPGGALRQVGVVMLECSDSHNGRNCCEDVPWVNNGRPMTR